MSYDDWKLATPWDDEVSIIVSFECTSCEFYNHNQDAIAGKGDEEVFVECSECAVMNIVER